MAGPACGQLAGLIVDSADRKIEAGTCATDATAPRTSAAVEERGASGISERICLAEYVPLTERCVRATKGTATRAMP
jgi:hypothetical protein